MRKQVSVFDVLIFRLAAPSAFGLKKLQACSLLRIVVREILFYAQEISC